MAQELIYTSFPKGVKPGVSGFCTVAVSPDLAPNMISRLEGLSGYRHLYMPGTPEADLNPPNWSHVVISVGNAESHVVYRVADAGLDYTGRSNKLAHFIVLDKNDLAPCGPAAMLTTPGLIDVAFDQQVGTRAFNRPIPRQLVSPRPCLAWRQAAGDAGWAGELAQTAWTGKYACIVYKPGMNVLALIQEAMALLPPERRWKTTFSTYYSKLPMGIDCQWRCVVAGTPEAAQAIAEVGAGLVIDLSNGALASAPDSPAAASARAGRMVLAPAGTKTVGTAARQRPVQNTRLSAAEVAVNAGIQDELQTIDSSNATSPEDELFNTIDSMPQLYSKPLKNKSKSSNLKLGLYIAAIIGVVLIGIAIATFFVLSAKSPDLGNTPVASSEDANSTNQTEQSGDELNSESTDAAADEERQKAEEQARLEAEERAKQEAEARQKAEEQARLEAQARQKEEEEKARQAEQARLEAEEKTRQERIQQQKEAEAKTFNDPRWVGADKKQYFIYIDSNDVPDCTRLNLQLQKRNSQIVKLELVPIYKDDSGFPGFELEQNSEDVSRYVVSSNSLSTDIVFQLNDNQNKTLDDASNSSENKPIFSIEGENDPAFSDFTHQNFLLATFSDKTTAVISFFRRTPDNDLKLALVQATMESNFNGSVFTLQTTGIEKTYFVTDFKIGCFGDSVTVNNSSYKIASAQINRENSNFEIQIDIKPVKFPKNIFDAPVETGSKLNSAPVQVETEKTLQSIVVGVEKDKKTSKFCKVKYSFIVYKIKRTIKKKESEAKNDANVKENPNANPSDVEVIEEESVERYSFGTLMRELYSSPSEGRKKFLMHVKELGANIPLYIDVYIQGDPIAGNATGSPFLLKRIVLPSFEESGK